jgi:ABC-type branched-subunit amino acid transport system substrate-binding protein
MRGWVVVVVVAIAVGVSAPVVSAQSSGASRQATEVGVTSSTIRIGVIADDDNPEAPGIFAGSPRAVEAWAKYVNAHGGVAGRKVQVDFIDSHLSDTDTTNAIITACSQDFAIVGTEALFMDNVSNLVGCPDHTGAATGLPDLAGFSTFLAEECSPVTFSPNPGQVDCATASKQPQSFRGNQGAVKYFLRAHKNLHGIFVYGNDVRSAAIGGLTLSRVNEAAGIKSDGEIGTSAEAPQSAYTPLVQQIKAKGSNYAYDTNSFGSMVDLRKEAVIQGVNSSKVIWDCASCYSDAFVQQGGADVEGTYVSLEQIPFNEAKDNPELATYVKAVGASQVDQFGAYAWTDAILFQDSINAIVKRGGDNALTRKALLAQLASTTSFNAAGMWGTTNVGQRIPSPCFILMQVKNGQFTRIYPTKPGTFDCTPSNTITVKANLINGQSS